MKKLVLMIVIAVAIWGAYEWLQQQGFQTSPESCAELAPMIVKMSQEKARGLQAKILKLYDPKDNPSPENGKVLDCIAEARWDRRDDSTIRFFLEKDVEGTTFYGYEPL